MCCRGDKCPLVDMALTRQSSAIHSSTAVAFGILGTTFQTISVDPHLEFMSFRKLATVEAEKWKYQSKYFLVLRELRKPRRGKVFLPSNIQPFQ